MVPPVPGGVFFPQPLGAVHVAVPPLGVGAPPEHPIAKRAKMDIADSTTAILANI